MATTAIGAPFPGRTLTIASTDRASVLAIQTRLNALDCGPVIVDGIFGQQTLDAVELYQSRSVDPTGRHLDIDGQVGPMTWAALFGSAIVNNSSAATPLTAKTLTIASAEIGVTEDPLGSNRGPKVDQYVLAVGLDPAGHYPWCAAFVYWCFNQAAIQLTTPGHNVSNPVIKTASVMDHWNRANATPGIRCLSNAECTSEPALVQPGMIFVILNSSGTGHTGLVESVQGAVLATIEGNTNAGGSREGIGVFRRTTRTIAMMRGFIDYGSSPS